MKEMSSIKGGRSRSKSEIKREECRSGLADVEQRQNQKSEHEGEQEKERGRDRREAF